VKLLDDKDRLECEWSRAGSEEPDKVMPDGGATASEWPIECGISTRPD